MLSILQQLLVAGNETTTHTISEGMLLLIRNPDQLQKVQANAELIPVMVEEVLRLTTPTANMWRVAVKDTEVNGLAIPAGTMLQIRFSSANRDENVYPDPNSFDVERNNVKTNIAFGHGVHMCVGANLARKELEVAFRVILSRMDDLQLDCAEEELYYPPNALLRGLAKLPVRFTARVSG
jgi:cytochrome P450